MPWWNMQRPTAQWVALELPPPISTNELFLAFIRAGKPVRVRSDKYKSWSSKAAAMIAEQNPARVEGPFGLRIVVPTKTRADISNCIKAVEDCLVSHGVTDDDRHCQNIEIRKGDTETTRIQIISTRGDEQ
jgi:Holliday junction resolvase RusA-like endonuclease